MGIFSSTILPDDDQYAYVVPNYVQLSENQTNEMLNSGQQPGVPFYLTENGQAIRPKAPRYKVKFVNNLSTIHKSSLELINDNKYDYINNKKSNSKAIINNNPKNIFILAFTYDAIFPTELNIYFGLFDRSSYNSINLSDHSIHWGPFNLKPGRNVRWESKDEYRFVNDYYLPSLVDGMNSANSYDIVITLKTMQPIKQSKENDKNIDTLNTPINSIVNQITQFSTSIVKGFHNYELSTSINSIENHIDKSIDKSNERLIYKKFNENNDSFENIVEMEVTYSRIILPNSTVQSNVDTTEESTDDNSQESSENLLTKHKNLPEDLLLRCILQRIISNDRIYIIQEVFDMIYKNQSNKLENEVTTVQENSDVDKSNEEKKEDKSNEFDRIDDECVVCLTNPKGVAGYPCRHTCLCIDCAESLSANGNKCPICRRIVTLLLYLPPKDTISKIKSTSSILSPIVKSL